MRNISPRLIRENHSPYNTELRQILQNKMRSTRRQTAVEAQKEEMANQKRINISDRHRIRVRLFFILLFILVGSVACFFVTNFYFLKKSVVSENTGGGAPILSLSNINQLVPDRFSKDGDTRINILVTGMGGKNHQGGNLTDSIQIVSIDPINKKAGIISLPRDLYVKVGNSYRKINEVYSYGWKVGQDGQLVKKVVGEVLDLKIHYFINIDFDGFEKLIDVLGGIDIVVDKAINDPFFPDEKMEGYEPFSITAGRHHLDGATALKYARSRETTSDFDRSRRQQQIMMAIGKKAMSLGVLSNPVRFNAVIKIIGSHIKTDIRTDEMKQLVAEYKSLEPKDVQKTLVISNSAKGALVNTRMFGGYGLIPKRGLGQYQEIQNIAHRIIPDPMVVAEGARISVKYLKNRQRDGLEIIERLTSYGYQVSDEGVITESLSSDDKIVVYTKKAPFTKKYLSKRYPDLLLQEEETTADSTEPDFVISLEKR